MSDSSPQPDPQSDKSITLDGVLQLLNSKLVSAGYSSALGALAIYRARLAKWDEAAKFAGAAAFVWIIIRIANR